MSKPHCYGKMDWINKYPEDNTPKASICDCGYVNSCLRHTRNRLEVEPLEEKYNKLLEELENTKESLALKDIEKCNWENSYRKAEKEWDRLKAFKPYCFEGKEKCVDSCPDIACKMCHWRESEK